MHCFIFFQELESKLGFLEEEQFLYETSIASKEFNEKYQIVGHLGKVEFFLKKSTEF